jgi:FdhE protein
VPVREKVAAYAVERVLPKIIEASITSGPPAMTDSILEGFHDSDFEPVIEAWLRGEELGAVQRYLARAAAGPVLEALSLVSASASATAARDDLHCPKCDGLPQVGYFAASPENLVTAHRYLECSRCATAWAFPRMTCAGCGEVDTAKLTVLGEVGTAQAERSGKLIKSQQDESGAAAPAPPPAHFPHMRIDGCRTCKRYILTVDLERDGRAVPVVDEIAAIPLSLYAAERGMNKIVPNLMGF